MLKQHPEVAPVKTAERRMGGTGFEAKHAAAIADGTPGNGKEVEARLTEMVNHSPIKIIMDRDPGDEDENAYRDKR